jgi:hypothetical protein
MTDEASPSYSGGGACITRQIVAALEGLARIGGYACAWRQIIVAADDLSRSAC